MKSAAILAFASAVSATNFGILVSRSASPIHLRTVDAQGQKLWIGKDTESYCPLDKGCPAGNQTLFAAAPDSSTLSMAVAVPGGQQVYINRQTGALGYTQAHSAAMPEGAITRGFKYTPPVDGAAFGYLGFKKRGFLACSTTGDSAKGPYQVFANLRAVKFDSKACLGFSALAVSNSEDPEEVGAWQYT